MIDETYPGEEQFLIDCDPSMNKGLVYYDPSRDEIVQLTRSKVYFRPQTFWKLVKEVGGKRRTVRAQIECKELMNSNGYEFLGEL